MPDVVKAQEVEAPDQVTPVRIRPKAWMQATGMTTGETFRHLYAGRLKAVQIGRAWYIEASELTDFFERMKGVA